MLVNPRLSKSIEVLKCLKARPGQTMPELIENSGIDDSTTRLVVDDLFKADWVKMERIGDKVFYSAPDEANTIIWLLEKAQGRVKAREELLDV